MNKEIFKNSYVMLLLTFLITYMSFYLLGIGFKTKVKDGKVKKHFSWEYPAAVSLTIWLVWHYYLFPFEEHKPKIETDDLLKIKKPKIIMDNWN